METDFYHVIVYTPVKNAGEIRQAAAKAGAGKIGNYDSCSFSATGTGRFRPLEGANPAIGTTGTPEEVQEERIEFLVKKEDMKNVLQAITKVHPYEEPATHVLPLLDYKQWL